MSGPASLATLFRESLRLGATTFWSGSGSASLAAVRRRLADRPGFAGPQEFEAGLGFLNVVPGGTPAQLCGYLGLKLRGLAGSVVAYLGYCLPGLVTMLALGWGLMALADFLVPEQAMNTLQGGVAGLRAVVPAIFLLAGLTMSRRLKRPGLLLGLFLGAGVLFVIGLKPFSMLLGGAILGVLLLPDPEGLPSSSGSPGGEASGTPGTLSGDPPAGAPYDWRLPAGLFLLYGLCAGGFFLVDATLGKLFLSIGKAEAYGFGGPGAFPILFADAVNARHWLTAPGFAAQAALAQAVPGPALAVSALLGWNVGSLAGALTALAGVCVPSFFILLAAAPAARAIGSCAWAGKALSGFMAVLGGMVAGLGARLAMAVTWDAHHGILAVAALALLAARVHPALVALLGAAAGALLGM
jgi:chromate transporter